MSELRELRLIKEQMLEKASKGESGIAEMGSLTAKIGEALIRKGLDLDQLVSEWDILGSGEITLVEFRKSLRDPKLGLPTALLEVGRVDALFQQLDEDHGGSLDLSEMRIAFQTFRSRARDLKASEEAARGQVQKRRQLAEEVQRAIDATEEFEEANVHLGLLRLMIGKEDSPQQGGGAVAVVMGGLDVRLYAAMVKKNLKVGELAQLWDTDGDGSISRAEFVRNVKALVSNAEDEEAVALFTKLDEDGGACHAWLPSLARRPLHSVPCTEAVRYTAHLSRVSLAQEARWTSPS